MPKRAPLVVTLLFFATVAVDAVAAYWMSESIDVAATTLFWALAASQSAIFSVSAVFSDQRKWWRAFAPLAFAFVAAFVAVAVTWSRFHRLNQDFALAYTALFQLHALVTFVVVWLLRQRLIQRKIAGTATSRAWQFSLLQALVFMTMLAIVVTLVKSSLLLLENWQIALLYIVDSAALTVIVIAAWRIRGSAWPIRLATALAAAALLAIIPRAWNDQLYWIPLNLIQVCVLWIWIHLAELVPRSDTEIETGVDAPPRVTEQAPPE